MEGYCLDASSKPGIRSPVQARLQVVSVHLTCCTAHKAKIAAAGDGHTGDRRQRCLLDIQLPLFGCWLEDMLPESEVLEPPGVRCCVPFMCCDYVGPVPLPHLCMQSLCICSQTLQGNLELRSSSAGRSIRQDLLQESSKHVMSLVGAKHARGHKLYCASLSEGFSHSTNFHCDVTPDRLPCL